MKSQMITLFGVLCLACIALAQDNSTDTAPLAASEDVKPAEKADAVAANQKTDTQSLDKEDVKAKANDAVDATADKLNDAKEGASDAIESGKNKASDAANSAADKAKETADAAKDKINNGASGLISFTATTLVMLALTRL